MKINNTRSEAISALMDGEVSAISDDLLIQELRKSEHQQVWNIYHQIGDTLRSDEMTVDCSNEFIAKLSARLDAEPSYLLAQHRSSETELAPQRQKQKNYFEGHLKNKQRFGRLPRVASGIAATAAVLYFGSPLLFNNSNRQDISVAQIAPSNLSPAAKLVSPNSVADTPVVVIRDQQIDAYLIAHQRFSPSLYSTSQFARSANFATDAGK